MPEASMALDPVDLHLLRLLQEDARRPLAELAAAIQRSPTTVRDRLHALETSGLLTGYGARVDWSKATASLDAVLTATCPPERVGEVAAALRQLPICSQALRVPGRRPVLAFLHVRGLQHVRSLLAGPLAGLGLDDVECSLAMEDLVPLRAVHAFDEIPATPAARRPGRKPSG